MTVLDLQDPNATRPPRPLRQQTSVDIDINDWIESRRKERDTSAAEFIYDVLSAAYQAEKAVA
jgi:hypothetical protein